MFRFRLLTLLCVVSIISILLVANTRPRNHIIGNMYDEPIPSGDCSSCERHNWPWVCGAEFGWPWVYRRESLKELHDLPFDYVQRQRFLKPNYSYDLAHRQFVEYMPYFDRFDWLNLTANIGVAIGVVAVSAVALEYIRIRYLVSVLIALCTAWISYQLFSADVKARTIVWLQDQGVEVRYGTNFDNDGQFVRNAKPPPPHWLEFFVGRERARSLIQDPSSFVVTEDVDVSPETKRRIFQVWPCASIELEELEDEPRHFEWDQTLRQAVPVQ